MCVAARSELVLVNPVNNGGSIVGFALIKLPYEPLRTSFERSPPAACNWRCCRAKWAIPGVP